MLRGILPIVITPFDAEGRIDEASLRRVVRFEMEGGADGIGVGGFASEAYKLTDAERLRCAEIVANEVGGQVPLIVGIAPGGTEAAIEQARSYASLKPAAFMTLPPATMKLDVMALVDHYINFAAACDFPVMVQQSPQIQAYSHTELSVDMLAEIAHRAPNVRYFKIEGPGSAERMAALCKLVGDEVGLFGGVGGIALKDELRAGAAGLLPGVGFNEHFVEVWKAWEAKDVIEVDVILPGLQPLVDAVSGHGHEFSLHARKRLLGRAGLIDTTYVRRPTVHPDAAALTLVDQMADVVGLRLLKKA